MTSEQEMAELGAETLTNFFQQFNPPDEVSQSLLNILLEELMNAKVISILSQSQQTGDQISDNTPERISSDFSIDISGIFESTDNLAKPNSEIDI